jgi:hypothetical protein
MRDRVRLNCTVYAAVDSSWGFRSLGKAFGKGDCSSEGDWKKPSARQPALLRRVDEKHQAKALKGPLD